jgi:predicted DNA-binding transcriptional regulator YafY
MGEDEPVQAELWVDATQAVWVISRVEEADIVRRGAEGDVTVVLRVRNRDAFRSFVLGLLDHAEVRAPDELRADLVDWLEAMAAS